MTAQSRTDEVRDADVLLRERRGSVMIATLNRPRKGNSLSHCLIDALDHMVVDHGGENAVRGGRVQFGACGQYLQAYGVGRLREHVEQLHHASDDLDRVLRFFLSAAHWITFDAGLKVYTATGKRFAMR